MLQKRQILCPATCSGAQTVSAKENTWYSVQPIVMGLPYYNKANLRDLIAATGLVISNWIQIVNFSARVTVKFDG